MSFEYTVTYLAVTYASETTGLIFKKDAPQVEPIPESLYDNAQYMQHLAEMGENEWELLSVQTLLRGMYHCQRDSDSGYGFGYSLTAGYYLFWKRRTT